MPEGHSVHRIAGQFSTNFVGHRVACSSPQGRFANGAALLDGHTMIGARAVGKQLFLEFDNALFLRVHLGIYGAWDFAGEITVDPTIAASNGRMGQTGQRGIPEILDDSGENSLRSIGAPRRTRLRMAEAEKQGETLSVFPPEPVGQVRVRLLTDTAVADLRGPTTCEVLNPGEVDTVLTRLGPDPLVDGGAEAQDRFIRAVHSKRTVIALLLMDQSVVSGIGNVYRAEILFRARLNPHIPGNALSGETIRALWDDWDTLLRRGVQVGQMLTMDGLSEEDQRRALASRADRHWVYKREGLPCRVCGTNIAMEVLGGRKLYWCPSCQA